ncbi:stage II sporulation protein R [Acetonema longum]|uniref:Stage II sporulation protein R n=1 Tax=Acetonema longum DSM 6540 TaxID=1009370 RepID=F7NN02_9FIRM|nr:stage II sporulation protein R [Acetonema longum]EGO62580.1 stage II sporulation protein R [Acetonema longum DSM 6540]
MNIKYGLSLCIIGLILGLAVLSADRAISGPKVLGNQEVVRFHVLANSDSAYDQTVKHKVRDAVISHLTPLLQDVTDAHAAKKVVMDQREKLQAAADAVLAAYGAPYRATVIDGHWQFPIKAYGDLVLPAGDYEAVKILLGEAKGSNWWCVLFPPLCFIDISNATAAKLPANGQEKPQTQAGNGKIEFKSKVMEWISEANFR